MNEEKKAIEELEEFIEDDEIQNISVFTAKKIKNIIDNQQKEIEALEIIHNTYKEMIEENNYISKDKIRKLINKVEEEYSNIMNNKEISLETKNIHTYQHNSMITVLEELLEEN